LAPFTDEKSIHSLNEDPVTTRVSGSSETQSVATISVHMDQDFDLESDVDMSGKTWAGASHWKFHKKLEPLAEQSKRGKKKVFFLDFNEVIDPEELKPPCKGSNKLSKATLTKFAADDSKYLLPDDLHFRPRHLQMLFNKNILVLLRFSSGPVAQVADLDIPSEVVGDIEDEKEPVGFEFAAFDSTHGANANESAFDADVTEVQTVNDGIIVRDGDTIDFSMGLIAEPTKVQKIDIGFARIAKKVDVRALKESLWQQISTGSQSVGSKPTFQQSISKLQGVVPPSTLENISVSYCFICLLHLANEKGLRLQPGQTKETSSLSAADVGFSTGDFTVLVKQ